MLEKRTIRNVTDASFGQEVLELSKQRPVIVDFWAPWCGPCRMLSPIIEKVVGSYGGRVVLAKVNTDENQLKAVEYGVQGVPSVKMFKDGRVVDEFVGLRDAAFLKQFIEKHLPSESDGDVERAEVLLEAGDAKSALQTIKSVLAKSPDHAKALLIAAGASVALKDIEGARAFIGRVPEGTEHEEARCSTASLIDLLDQTAIIEVDGHTDLDRMFTRALRSIREGAFEQALDLLVTILSRDRAYRNGAPKNLILKIFDVLGRRSETSDRYRKRLAEVLY